MKIKRAIRQCIAIIIIAEYGKAKALSYSAIIIIYFAAKNTFLLNRRNGVYLRYVKLATTLTQLYTFCNYTKHINFPNVPLSG